ncbi:TPA: DUF551 domain-containing protein [Yersinia enterocolitica]|nr:DUF551 domain-containing protein [Yersinia enterocolitica]
MKELDNFTVERLEELSTKENIPEVAALARIALAAKRAEGLPGNIYPDISGEITALEKILKWILNLEVPTTGATNMAILLGNTIELLRDCQKPIVATPQLNSPEIPDGWINCSDQMPEVGDVVITAYQGCTNIGQMERSGKTYRYFTSIASGRELPATHWMPLPAAPEKPL